MTKQTKTTIASIAFLVVVVLHILGILFNETMVFFTKPFLMISLVIVYLVSSKKSSFWVISALFFSFWGDVFLLFKEEFFFYGLASFLIAHILYIKITAGFLKKISFQKILYYSIPFFFILLGLIFLIKDNLGEILIPVIVYGITICTFGAVALLNYIQERTTENLWLFLGAIIFIISDSLIAINRFYEPKEMYAISIMITYIVAQYLICKAMVVKNAHQ